MCTASPIHMSTYLTTSLRCHYHGQGPEEPWYVMAPVHLHIAYIRGKQERVIEVAQLGYALHLSRDKSSCSVRFVKDETVVWRTFSSLSISR